MNEHALGAAARRVTGWAVACAVITLSLGGLWLWALPVSTIVRAVLALTLLAVQLAIWRSLHTSLLAPLRALTNVVEAYRSGDYALRSRSGFSGDVLGHLAQEINALGKTLHEQRLNVMEASALLDKLVGTIDVAILAFNGEHKVRVINPAASRLLRLTASEALGRSAVDLTVDEMLAEGVRTQVITSLAGQRGRWQVTHGTFREGGLTQHLLIIADVMQALREEERATWRRLIRVISHEVNNSLAPIKSLAGTLRDMLSESVTTGLRREDALFGLQVIERRTDSLKRFLDQYSRLARISEPRRCWVRLTPLVARVVKLVQAHAVVVEIPEDLEIFVDEDQIEQALINLVTNAVEAHGDGKVAIRLSVCDSAHDCIVMVIDEGAGIANPDNLFVPFFTTKAGGSGIGLLLCRQIAEAHGGTLRLENRTDGRGATATLEMPGAARRAQKLASDLQSARP
jgi:nitrogen fixation/metabolism regulation signal transduction histidine kinase